jgi:hypothetical protein
MKNIKLWEPWYFENSKLPIWLSKIAPINVWAFSAAFWVFCRGEMKPRTRRHEAIHYQQQLDMLWNLLAYWLCQVSRWQKGVLSEPFRAAGISVG